MQHRLNVVVVRVAACAVLLTAVAAVLTVGPAQARVIKLSNGRVLSVMLPKGAKIPAGATIPRRQSASSASCDRSTDNGTLSNGCGPVVHSSQPYLIFWDPASGLSGKTEQLMGQYLTDTATPGTAANDVYGVVRQYFDSTGYAGQSQSFSASTQAFVDTHTYPAKDTSNCPAPSSFTNCVTDAQVQAEISRLITAKHWPAGGVSTNAPIYFVVLPQSTDECIDGGPGDCADTGFCAYHSWYGSGGTDVLYSVIPFEDGKDCQTDGLSNLQSPNSDPADVMVDNVSHEYDETVTDPLAGNGWVNSAYGWEVTDLCEQTGPLSVPNATDPNAYLPTLGGDASAGTLYDQSINGDHYYTETVWSNGENDCKAHPGASKPTPATLTPAFTAPSVSSSGTAASFDPTSSTVTGGISSATWDWGDGTTSFGTGALAAQSHTFSANGTYTVKLTLVDDWGDVASVSHQVQVGSTLTPPTATFTAPSTVPVGQPATFDGTASSDPNTGGSIQTYNWDFGDGTSGTGAQPQHNYSRPGTYAVSLTVTDNYGLNSTATTHKVVVSAAAPTAAFTAPSSVPVGQPATFDATGSTDPNNGATPAYNWDFGDGTTGTGKQPQHTYTQPGTYTVSLTVTDNYGLSSTAVTHTVVVSAALPIAAITSSRTAAAGQAVAFGSDQSRDPNSGGSITAYRWSFGDGSTSTGPNVQHAYTAPGTYTVQLSVIDNYGQTATSTTQVVIVAAGRILSSTLQTKHGAHYLLVSVSEAGTVAFGKRSAQTADPGTLRFKLSLSRRQKRQLAKHHLVRLKVTLMYQPVYGSLVRTSKTITIKH